MNKPPSSKKECTRAPDMSSSSSLFLLLLLLLLVLVLIWSKGLGFRLLVLVFCVQLAGCAV